MRFPWSKGQPRNSGPALQTSVSSLDRDRERQIAEKYSAGDADWIAARYRLIEEVLEYRHTGVLTQSFLDACEAEYDVAAWAHSQGVRRLVELSMDGHAAATARIEALCTSKDWRVRYEGLRTSFQYAINSATRRQIVRRGLTDRSGRIRERLASEAVFAHLIDMANDIEQAAADDTNEASAKAMFSDAYFLRLNEKTGVRGSMGGSVKDFADLDLAWATFKAERRRGG